MVPLPIFADPDPAVLLNADPADLKMRIRIQPNKFELKYTKKEFEVLSNVNNVIIVLSAKVYLDKKLKKERGTITFNSTIINNYRDNNNIQFFTQVSVILYNGIINAIRIIE